MKLVAVIVLVLAACNSETGGQESENKPQWTYLGRFGVQYWPQEYPTCGGNEQSPINIDPYFTRLGRFQPFLFRHYQDMPRQATLINNGHTLEVEWEGRNQPMIAGGNLGSHYTFVQYHVHWGSDDFHGSEHTINYNRFPMEMHLVHFKTEYGSLSNALNYTDGIVVLGIHFYISPFDNLSLDPLVSHLQQYQEVGRHELTTGLYPIASLLPRDLTRFYRYHGSLTTPSCNQDVTWTIFEDRVPVSERQMMSIRSIHNAEGGPLLNNFRPTQRLNGRTIWRSQGTGSYWLW